VQQDEKNSTTILRYIITSVYFLTSMHTEILSKEQVELLPLLYNFKREFYLVRGTAIAVQIFDQLFSAKLFRAQLSYFDDVNHDEPVEFHVSEPSESEIKQFLIERALDIDAGIG